MTALEWILLGGVAMSAIALVGSVTLVLGERRLERLLVPLVALAAGSLIGGAFFHMLPAVLSTGAPAPTTFAWAAGGFVVFMVLEQFLHWHHEHGRAAAGKEPLTYLVLLGDGLHNLLGGMAVAGSFLIDPQVGISAWLAAAAHEVPQELGDFGVLVHGGWKKGRALLFNVLSGSTFLVGGLVTYWASFEVDVVPLVAFAAGNFLYLGASDLVPEVNRSRAGLASLGHVGCFVLGLVLLYALRP